METMQENRERKTRFHGKSLVFGILVIAFGLLWLLHNTEFISDNIWDHIISWEMLLIAIGLINVLSDDHRGFGALLILVGGFFLLSDIYEWPLTFHRIFWPAVLILIGLSLIFGRMGLHRRRWFNAQAGSDDFIEDISVFSGHDRAIHSQSFKGGKIVSVFGGSKIDLVNAKLDPSGQAIIEMVCIFGGSTVIVPPDWHVKVEILNIFGGYADKRPRVQVDLNKTLTIKGIALFGGGEIKSY
jgi:predicted membrane protein